jgi:anti-anti-sigma regulatory factor
VTTTVTGHSPTELDAPGHGAADPPPSLCVRVTTLGDMCVIRLEGVLVRESLSALEGQVDHIGGLSFRNVLLDVRHLRRIDEAGRNVLVGLHHYVVARGARMVTKGASAAVARSLGRGPSDLLVNTTERG